MKDSVSDELYSLLVKKLTGEASEKELEALAYLLQRQPELCNIFELVECWWNEPRESFEEDPGDAYEKHIKKMHERYRNGKPGDLFSGGKDPDWSQK